MWFLMFIIFMTLCTSTSPLPSTCFSFSLAEVRPRLGWRQRGPLLPQRDPGRLQAAEMPASRTAQLHFSTAVRVRDTQLGILQAHTRPHTISGVFPDAHALACLESALPRATLHKPQEGRGKQAAERVWVQLPKAAVSSLAHQPHTSTNSVLWASACQMRTKGPAVETKRDTAHKALGKGLAHRMRKVELGWTHNQAHFLSWTALCLGQSSPTWLLFSAQRCQEPCPKSQES